MTFNRLTAIFDNNQPILNILKGCKMFKFFPIFLGMIFLASGCKSTSSEKSNCMVPEVAGTKNQYDSMLVTYTENLEQAGLTQNQINIVIKQINRPECTIGSNLFLLKTALNETTDNLEQVKKIRQKQLLEEQAALEAKNEEIIKLKQQKILEEQAKTRREMNLAKLKSLLATYQQKIIKSGESETFAKESIKPFIQAFTNSSINIDDLILQVNANSKYFDKLILLNKKNQKAIKFYTDNFNTETQSKIWLKDFCLKIKKLEEIHDVKGEFETTAEFKARVDLLNEIRFGNYLNKTFKYQEAHPNRFRYDADKELWTITGSEEFARNTIFQDIERYEGVNAFGVKKIITKTTEKTCSIKTINATGNKFLPMPISEAKEFKNKLRKTIFFNVIQNKDKKIDVKRDYVYSKPTIDYPYEKDIEKFTIPIRIKAIVYHNDNNEVIKAYSYLE